MLCHKKGTSKGLRFKTGILTHNQPHRQNIAFKFQLRCNRPDFQTVFYCIELAVDWRIPHDWQDTRPL
jgi:hypothetical protein